jgi:transketolase
MISVNINNVKKEATRAGYGRGLVKIGEKNKNVVALCCDLTESTKVDAFKKKFPDRFIEIGVAEQNMAGIAAGLALSGKIPYISSYATFSPGRNWDQIRVSVCYNNVDVKIQGAHAGISVGPDGATHQALEDIGIMRVLPNMNVIVPCDSVQTEKATIASLDIKGPVYLRMGRNDVPVITSDKTPFKFGKADIYREGKDVAIIACGVMVYEALVAAEILAKEGIKCTVVNSHTIKPLDVKTLVEVAKKTKAIVTAEEHQITAGLGSAVAEALGENYAVPIERVGVPDTFGESGKPEELMIKYSCSHTNIIAAVKKVIKRKK